VGTLPILLVRVFQGDRIKRREGGREERREGERRKEGTY
jgi:hypothetical protein